MYIEKNKDGYYNIMKVPDKVFNELLILMKACNMIKKENLKNLPEILRDHKNEIHRRQSNLSANE